MTGRSLTAWDRSLAGKKCDGPGGCGHALSRHNSLGYCRHTSKRDGDCICGDWRAERRRELAGLDRRGPAGAGTPR